MTPKQKTSSHTRAGSEIVRSFLGAPRVAQEVMLAGLRHELTHGDRASALELLDALQGDERSRAVLVQLDGSPKELTEQETREIVAKLEQARLPKSKVRRRW